MNETIQDFYPKEEILRIEMTDDQTVRYMFNHYFCLFSLDFIREYANRIDWYIIERDFGGLIGSQTRKEFKKYLKYKDL